MTHSLKNVSCLLSFLFSLITVFSAEEPQIEPLRYAQNFKLEQYSTHKILTIRNTWIGAGDDEQTYALVPKNSDLPELPKDALIVRTPVERLVIMATVFLGPIQDLQLHDSLVGIAYLNFANDPIAHERIAKGLAKPIQSGTAMDVESLMMIRPDLILTSTTGNPNFDVHPQLVRAKLPVVVMAGYMEEHPLARTEWIKCIAAFYDKEAKAATLFDQVVKRYESLLERTQELENRPTVMSSAPYGGIWHVPGGKSYTSKAFADAGADYVWADIDSRGGVALDFELILQDAHSADFWLHPSHYDSIASLLKADERFVGFQALKTGHVYNNNLRVNEHGGNDIFERGVSHPEEVLADLIKTFHPEILPNHEFVFYQRLK
ncbi:MAG: ABC transporter substrate-binding protein [Opitutaceae bacterium]|nr:ABC transporter substrate-binding protein [Opitutaceae bacterium]